ncbi:uncharacterized protein SCHCODRAFT_02636742 [Schizophyllum commune H4-8]|uniref:uncharacterized protein n=1 Tax=Schizophyllum commune (strain H4-8 / FGSC 9210) TaxID=578458 RepID=UPI002160BD78|nr:uncharacterized protein SCHCODRAFT_02636742 [Schizophyllum commune H4-8]KAI5888445.1 hypothetical protein SCHCODRAFT_02636742 [Schizophyllum commune H4-8]
MTYIHRKITHIVRRLSFTALFLAYHFPASHSSIVYQSSSPATIPSPLTATFATDHIPQLSDGAEPVGFRNSSVW